MGNLLIPFVFHSHLELGGDEHFWVEGCEITCWCASFKCEFTVVWKNTACVCNQTSYGFGLYSYCFPPKTKMHDEFTQKSVPNTGNFVQIFVRLAWVWLHNKPHYHYWVVPPAIHEGFPSPILIGKPITLTLTRSSQKSLPHQIPGHMHCGWGLLCFKSLTFSYLIVL